jgi:trigger factor
MSTTVETISPLERKLSLNLSVDRVNAEVEQRLKKVARTTRMPGFRPGKVPMKFVVQNYGAQIHSEVLNDELNRSFQEAVRENDLKVAGAPRIEPGEGAAEGQMAFSATFEVFPEVKLGDMSTFEVEKVECTIGEPEIDRTLDILRKQRQTFTEAGDRAAQNDDRLTVDFAGRIDGVAFEGGTSTDFTFALGAGQMLPAFEEAARGMKVGETKTFPLPFPEDYHGKEVAGKTAEFDITVKKIEAPQLPELTDAFAAELGVSAGTVAALRDDVKLNLTREVKNRLLARNKEAVMDVLVKAISFDVPKSLVESETQDLVARTREDFKGRGMPNADTMDLPADLFKDQAERRVRLGLIVNELVRTHNLQAKPEQIRAYIEEASQGYENPVEVMQYYFADRSRIAEVEAVVLEENVVDWALSQLKVAAKSLSFEDLMGTR